MSDVIDIVNAIEKMNLDEEWREISENYELKLSRYRFSNLGNVKSIKTRTCDVDTPIGGSPSGEGYWETRMTDDDGKLIRMMTHRLIALAFLEYKEDWKTLQVNHIITTNRCDNRAINLEWVTAKENSNMKNPDNISYGSPKQIEQIDKTSGIIIKTWNSITSVCEKMGFNSRKFMKIIEECGQVDTDDYYWKLYDDTLLKEGEILVNATIYGLNLEVSTHGRVKSPVTGKLMRGYFESNYCRFHLNGMSKKDISS